MPTKPVALGVNIDHVATLRQARQTRYPDPVQAAFVAQQAGADAITVHLREDRRHIQERDLHLLKETLQVPMNLEMAVSQEMGTIAKAIKPAYCLFVPEQRQELTTEGGLNVTDQLAKVKAACHELASHNIPVSLFIDADKKQIDSALTCGAAMVELHTGHFADANSAQQAEAELAKIIAAVDYALKQGLVVNAGHGLHYHNVQAIAQIPGISELNIGHSIICQAVFHGLAAAVKQMKDLIVQANCMS
jgi:pyridoxine 5-phosphate synthase